MNHADKITQRIEQMNVSSTAAMRDKILSDAAQTMEQTIDARNHKPSVGRTIMNSKLIKFAVAAVVIVTLTTIYQFTGSIDGASTAYARMIENVRRAHSVSYKQTYVHDDGKSDSCTVVKINSDGVTRFEIMDNTVLLFYPNRDFSMTLWTRQKRAFITRRKNMRAPQIDMLEYTLNTKNLASEYKGQHLIEGQLADLYVSEWEFGKNSVWVDPQTELPLYVEQKEYKDPNRIYPALKLAVADFGGDSGRCGAGGGGPYTTIKSDFQWNIELDESLFDEFPPADYSVTEQIVHCSDPNESHVVEALRFWAEDHDGKFPPCVEILGDANELRPMLIKKFDQDGDPEKEYETAFVYGNLVLKGIRFAQNKTVESNGLYHEDVMLGEADKPLFWWKLKDSEVYRVIYGDLTMEDIESENLPQ